MKRIILFVVGLLGSLVISQAQDLITTRKGEDIQAKILEVSSNEIKYKRYSNPDGPLYIINTSEVLMVRYENGEKDIFDEEQFPLNANGEIYEGMKYRELKGLYNHRYYIPEIWDPYSRGWAGVASFFIPGLGQGVCGEWGRGACIFLANMGIATLAEVGVLAGAELDNPNGPYTLALAAMAGMVAFDIWNIIDAVNVAKVKNMYYQDLRKMRSSMDIKMEPFLTYTPSNSSGGSQAAAGLALKVSF